jgi:hypothetical protein
MAIVYGAAAAPQFRQKKDLVLTNPDAITMYAEGGATGVCVFPVTDEELKGSILAIKVSGYGNADGYTGIVAVDKVKAGSNAFYALRIVAAGQVALATYATSHAVPDTSVSADTSANTDDKVNVGWYTDTTSGLKFLAVRNRLDDGTIAAGQLEISVL